MIVFQQKMFARLVIIQSSSSVSSSPPMLDSTLVHASSSPPHLHSSMQTRLFYLHEHLLAHFVDLILVASQLHLTSCKMQSVAVDFIDSSGIKLPSSSFQPSLRGFRFNWMLDAVLGPNSSLHMSSTDAFNLCTWSRWKTPEAPFIYIHARHRCSSVGSTTIAAAW